MLLPLLLAIATLLTTACAGSAPTSPSPARPRPAGAAASALSAGEPASSGMDTIIDDGGVRREIAGGWPPAATWMFDGSQWRASGTPPVCPSSPMLRMPVNLDLVTAVLYPGQVRGGNYKAHGGFRFGPSSNTITVTSPISGTVYRAARYVEAGETQYLFDLQHPCGVMIRFDHLLELSPRFASIAATLPPPTDSTMTTMITGQTVSAGEMIATAIGFRQTQNVSVDFGVYDLRQRNPATASQPGEQAAYGVCWFDWMPASDGAVLRALPPGDGVQGRNSDYCR